MNLSLKDIHRPISWYGASLKGRSKEEFNKIKGKILHYLKNPIDNRSLLDIVDCIEDTQSLGVHSIPVLKEIVDFLRVKLLSKGVDELQHVVILLDILVKNSGYRLHVLIGRRTFMKTLSLVGRRCYTNTKKEYAMLALLIFDCFQAWGEAFLPRKHIYPQIHPTYWNLRTKYCVDFPRPEFDPTRVPIFLGPVTQREIELARIINKEDEEGDSTKSGNYYELPDDERSCIVTKDPQYPRSPTRKALTTDPCASPLQQSMQAISSSRKIKTTEMTASQDSEQLSPFGSYTNDFDDFDLIEFDDEIVFTPQHDFKAAHNDAAANSNQLQDNDESEGKRSFIDQRSQPTSPSQKIKSSDEDDIRIVQNFFRRLSARSKQKHNTEKLTLTVPGTPPTMKPPPPPRETPSKKNSSPERSPEQKCERPVPSIINNTKNEDMQLESKLSSTAVSPSLSKLVSNTSCNVSQENSDRSKLSKSQKSTAPGFSWLQNVESMETVEESPAPTLKPPNPRGKTGVGTSYVKPASDPTVEIVFYGTQRVVRNKQNS